METKATTYSPAFHLITWIALIGDFQLTNRRRSIR